MSYPFTLDTPERVLRRVEAMEEMELPSLPSFQHDGMDFDTGTMTEAESSRDDPRSPAQSEKLTARYGVTTPHPMRRTMSGVSNATVRQETDSPAESSSLSSSSPYPPVRSPTEQGTPSPYLLGKAATSTPQSQATSRSKRYASENETRSTVRYAGGRFERGRSVTDSAVGESTTRTAKRWATPGEMSASFSGEEIPVDGEQSVNFGSDLSLPVPGNQRSGVLSEVSQSSMNIAPTPITKRLSTSRNVVLQRPGRRSQSLAKQAMPMPSTPGGIPSPIAESDCVPSPAMPEGQPAQDRVPSMSRSQMTHSSGGARTPESQPPAMRSTTPESPSRDMLPEPSLEDAPSQMREEQTASFIDSAQHSNSQAEHEAPSVSYAPAESPGRSLDPPSPVQSFHTPSGISEFSTPGVARGSGTPMQENLMVSNPFNRMRESTPVTALQDISQNRQSFAYTPFTPSPLGIMSKDSDFSTPRAPLDDAERRKSHVLAVLSSTGLPSRTTRPLRGTPHPTRRGLAAPGSESIAEEEGTPTSFRQTSAELGSQFQLTVASFQGDGSFVSIASSADLTSDKRASRHPVARGNTSFPTILLPTSGGGSSSAMGSLHGSEGRADGVKIHKHLNAMNKQLLETNGELAREAEAWRAEVDRLRGMLVDAGVEVEDMDIVARLADMSRSPGASSRSGSLGPPPSLGDLSRHSFSARQALGERRRSGSSTASASRLERLDEVGQDEQIAIMQEMVDKLEMLEQGLDEKDQLIADLEARLESEPASVELREEVDRLRVALEQGEKARNDLHAEFAHKTEQHAKQFGEICSGFETQVKALETDLANSKAELDRLREEKGRLEGVALAESQSEKEAQLRKQVAQLEEELSLLRQDARQAEQELDALRQTSQQEKEDLARSAKDASDKAAQLQTQLEELQDRFEELTKASDELHVQLDDAQEARRSAEEEQAILQREVEEFSRVKTFLEEELVETREKVEVLTTRLEELDARGNETTEADDLRRDIEDLEGKLAEQDAELEVLRGKLAVADMSFLAPRTPGQATTTRDAVSASSAADQTSFVAALEDRLDDAYREIGRLKHELASTPRHQSTLEARDAKIKALEAEKASLKARLNSLKQSQSRSQSFLGGNSTVLQAAASPFGRPTPLAHGAIAALKTPKTPGPLKDLSWLNTTVGDAAEPVLRAQVDYLQDELKRANDQLDQNFSRLEEAGFGGVRLAEKLAKAEERIAELEDEIRALSQRNKASLALVSLNKKGTMLADGDRAKETMDELHGQIDDLKADMKAEKARLQKENKRLQDLLSDLQVTNDAQIDRLRAEMAQLVDDLEAERRKAKSGVAAASKSKVRLEQDVVKSSARVRELERNLAEQRERYEQLTRRFDEAAQQATSRVEVTRQSSTIRSLEADLRDARKSADDLRAQLHRQSSAQRQAEARVAELEREKKRIAENLDAFERDFLIQEEEVQKLGEQLRLLGMEKSTPGGNDEAVRVQLEKELRSTRQKLQAAQRDLETERDRYEDMQRQASRIVTADGQTATALADQKSRFKTQAREMATQIQYLKAKYTRESTFRNALALQKRYLLLLVGGMSLNEQATLKAIASMGFPVPASSRPKRTFKSVAIAVLSVVRARKAAAAWRAERENKAEAVASHEERRRVSGPRV